MADGDWKQSRVTPDFRHKPTIDPAPSTDIQGDERSARGIGKARSSEHEQ